MGNMSASQGRSKDASSGQPNKASSSPALVFCVADGRLKEFKQRTTAGEVVVSDETFLASSESMEIGWYVPKLECDEVLQPGQLYFLLPVSFLLSPLSLHDLCDLAVRVGAVLRAKEKGQGAKGGTDLVKGKRCVPIPEVAHLVSRVERLKFRSGTCRK